ncbi:AraC family transcriptional regulator [Sansalvadorimonas sp. 2012CJ34-2]|uniref:AraC family transcriptional regulator n=1 Tax=Parendozoicomonas callyspongiae TaxID=2942213 RepID=A0ABT0PE73_9GAMM|nr:AraC family transcriptional regulator [Sansalvadorimonas sp. 2012CJ34-2]MCL6269669.1 AraC family transcriptional regulator [Sansalvadorimonas sp. 2012CJ34-2]
MAGNRHIEQMQSVLACIEQNLDSDINIAQLASIACYSEYHFHRVFRAFIGESVYAYRKRLLLERAVVHLRYGEKTVTDIALDCGYDSSSAFNKAFRNQFNCTPSEVRSRRLSLPPTPLPMLKENQNMKARIVEIDDIAVISARETGQYSDAASRAWQRLMSFAYGNRLMNKDIRSFGISHDDPTVTSPEQLRYDACLDIDSGDLDIGDLQKQTIPGGRYARFTHKGPYEQMTESFSAFFTQWLPESGKKLRDQPCFMEHMNRDPRRTKPENLRTEVYIPIK